MAPVIKALRNEPCFQTEICVTAQHRHALDQVLSLFDIQPDYDLNLMQPGHDLTDITSQVLIGMREVLRRSRPDMVLVHGDTTTTLAASLATYYEKVAIGHIEAGLRTGNSYAPWPEEMNRRLTTTLANLHFAPSDTARNHLLAEGVSDATIHVTGNTVIDALYGAVNQIRSTPDLLAELEQNLSFLDPEKRWIVVTGHRRESFGAGIENMCPALNRIAQRGDVEIVYPVHLNPNIQTPVQRLLGGHPSIHLIEPLDYLSFVYLMDSAYLILTDSGGVQGR